MPNQMEKRKAMFLWRGANLQLKRKTCESACKDVREYTGALGDDYKSVYFSCSYIDNGNNESVSKHMREMTAPTGTACKDNGDCMRATSRSVRVLD